LLWLTVTDEVFVWLTVLSPTTWPALTVVFTFIVVSPQSLGVCRHYPTALLSSHAYAAAVLLIVEVLVWVTSTVELLLWVMLLLPTTWPALTFVFTCMPRPP
jgi:hypothetical protein